MKTIVSGDRMGGVLFDVQQERVRQVELHKQGKFPFVCEDPTIADSAKFPVLAEEFGEAARVVNEMVEIHHRRYPGESEDVIRDSAQQAIKRRKGLLREELVQIAAVCVAWCEALDAQGEAQALGINLQELSSDWWKDKPVGTTCMCAKVCNITPCPSLPKVAQAVIYPDMFVNPAARKPGVTFLPLQFMRDIHANPTLKPSVSEVAAMSGEILYHRGEEGRQAKANPGISCEHHSTLVIQGGDYPEWCVNCGALQTTGNDIGHIRRGGPQDPKTRQWRLPDKRWGSHGNRVNDPVLHAVPDCKCDGRSIDVRCAPLQKKSDFGILDDEGGVLKTQLTLAKNALESICNAKFLGNIAAVAEDCLKTMSSVRASHEQRNPNPRIRTEITQADAERIGVQTVDDIIAQRNRVQGNTERCQCLHPEYVSALVASDDSKRICRICKKEITSEPIPKDVGIQLVDDIVAHRNRAMGNTTNCQCLHPEYDSSTMQRLKEWSVDSPKAVTSVLRLCRKCRKVIA